MHVLLPSLLACTGPGLSGPGYQGLLMSPFFPTDGTRQAEYVNEDVDNITWKLVVEKVEPTETVDGIEVTTFEWSRDDTGDIVGGVKWSSDEQILIHGFAVGTDEYTTFDTPVVVADEYMNRDESVTTETNGYTFTSTFVGVEDCPVQWGLDWTDCTHIRLDDGDGDDMSGPIFAGDYWLVQRYGPAWMLLTGYTEKWNLAHYDWEPE